MNILVGGGGSGLQTPGAAGWLGVSYLHSPGLCFLMKTPPLARIVNLPKMHEDLNLALPAEDIRLLKDVQCSLLAPLIIIVVITLALPPFRCLVAPSPG